MNATWLDSYRLPGAARRLLRNPAARSRPDIRFMALPDCTIRYRLAGNGPRTLVFATDPPVMLEHYDALIAELARDFRVVVFELPAFGHSLPRLGMDFGHAAAVASVTAFLQQLGPGPYVLAFPCVPAYVAIAIAGAQPELVSALVIIQAPHWHEELKWKRGRDPQNLLGRPWLGQLLMHALKSRRAGHWYTAALGQRGRLDEFLQPTLDAFRQGARFSLASAFQHFLTPQEPPLPSVSQPTLVLWGEADRSHRHTDKRSTLRYAPQARFERFEHSGHFPELEETARFAVLLREFLAEPAPAMAAAGR